MSQYAGEFKAGLRSGEGKCEYVKTQDKFVGQWLMGARAQGLMFCADGEVERVGFLNDKLIRREKIALQEQERLKCEANGEVYVAPDAAPKVEEAPEEPEKKRTTTIQEPESQREASKKSVASSG